MFRSLRHFIVFLLILFNTQLFTQIGKPAYPIIFVHGLIGDDQSFIHTISKFSSDFNWGDIYVYDVVLNADNTGSTGNMTTDVQFENFYFNAKLIQVNRRTYAADVRDFQDGWQNSNSRIFVINFAEERIRGAAGGWLSNDLFDGNNQSAILKQGFALQKMIESVLEFTNAEKVILVGHSMGGLAIREYLQRTVDGSTTAPHKWWIESSSENGHKVAKVITIGTPHLGSNAAEWPVKSGVPNFYSEAIRDLRYSYHSSHGDLDGVYLFGGSEETISQYENFQNYDVNCNGTTTDVITGIDAHNNTVDNPDMPLPRNIPYCWITSDVGTGGDLVVDLSRQWLHTGNNPAPVGITDTLLTNRAHTNEGSDWYSILRGLDEPAGFDFAYGVKLNTNYTGAITVGMNTQANDTDCYKIHVDAPGTLTLNINRCSNTVTGAEIFNAGQSSLISSSINGVSFSMETYIDAPGDYFIKISGRVTNTVTYDDYLFNLTFSEDAINADFSVSQVVGHAPLTIHFSDLSTGNPVQWEWDFDNDGVVESTIQNPDFTYTQPGTYSVKLKVVKGALSSTKVLTNLIQVTQQIPLPNLYAISYIEYYIDQDPGRGRGHALSFTHGNDIGVSTVVNLSNVANGVHTLFVRSRDANGTWSLPNSLLFLKTGFPQGDSPFKIVKAEYYVDNDPGNGLGVNIPVITNDSINTTFTIPLSNIANGVHTVFFRVKDALGKWSLENSHIFLKTQLPVQGVASSITKAEYYIDSDLVSGSGTDIPINVGTNITTSVIVPLTNISNGVHTVYFKVRDAAGKWSLKNSSIFLKTQFSLLAAASNITKAEYYIDSDTSSGSIIDIPISADTSIITSIVIPLTNISNGVHTVYFRVKDAAGNWSLKNSTIFLKQQFAASGSLPDIVKAEFYLDIDPGLDSATSIPFLPGTSIEKSFIVPLDSVPNGIHTLYIRVKDVNNKWSLKHSQLFLKQNFYNSSPAYITSIKYAIRDSALLSDTVTIPCNSQTSDFVIDFNAFAPALQCGKHYLLKVWAEDNYNKKSLINYYDFYVRDTMKIFVTALIEGFFNNAKQTPDTVVFFLRQPLSPFDVVDTAKVVLDSLGKGIASFSHADSSKYYLVLNHRNSIETWSSEGGNIFDTKNTNVYDFTSSDRKAYGGNLKLIGGKWCVISGDVNQDGIVDFSDLILVDNAASVNTTGYVNTDLNGDGLVDFNDLTVCNTNAYYFFSVIKPIVSKSAKTQDLKKKSIEIGN